MVKQLEEVILLPEKDKKARINKLFLLVFHGGLVCYLILHNLLMPLVKNMGRGDFLFKGLHYYFLPQLLLFIFFLRSDLTRPKKGYLPLVITANLTILMISLVFFALSLEKGFSRNDFTTSISLISIAVFFLGFFLYFKDFFLWRFEGVKRQGLLGLFLGGIFVFLHSLIPYEVETGPALEDLSVKIESDWGKTNFELPSGQYSSTPIEINETGFMGVKAFYPLGQKLFVTNDSTKKHVVRLEYIKNDKWYFKKVLILGAGEREEFPFLEKGIYRLYSPSSKIGPFIVVLGGQLFEQGTYYFDAHGLKVVTDEK